MNKISLILNFSPKMSRFMRFSGKIEIFGNLTRVKYLTNSMSDPDHPWRKTRVMTHPSQRLRRKAWNNYLAIPMSLLLSSHTHKKVDTMHGMQEIVTFPAKTTSHFDGQTPKYREINAKKKQISLCNCLWLFKNPSRFDNDKLKTTSSNKQLQMTKNDEQWQMTNND